MDIYTYTAAWDIVKEKQAKVSTDLEQGESPRV